MQLPSTLLENAVAAFAKLPGIGKKTAEKIVLELRDKMKGRHSEEEVGSLRGESDAILALQSLGYSQSEARDALREIPSEGLSTNERIKQALKFLGK